MSNETDSGPIVSQRKLRRDGGLMTSDRLSEIRSKVAKFHASRGGPTECARELLAEVDRLLPLEALVRRYLGYHDGVASCDSGETVERCGCAVCCDARYSLRMTSA